MRIIYKIFKWFFLLGCLLSLAGTTAIITAYFYLSPTLPDINSLKNVELQIPLRIYTHDQQFIAEFGEMKRIPVTFENIPKTMINAIIAAEDDRFFIHPGVDYQGIIRAVVALIRTGKKRQGGSTITMQVARNFFLSNKKTYLRKLNEIFLAIKIEQMLSKKDILQLYLNKIYLGHRSYGVAAAAQVYYGKTLDALRLDQFAMLAGLPKAPSKYNPVTNKKRATIRRNYVLGRMYHLHLITKADYDSAINMPDDASIHIRQAEVQAPYIAEMVRQDIIQRYGESALNKGYKVYTSIRPALQAAAQKALRDALVAYDKRHGYRHDDITHIPAPFEEQNVSQYLHQYPQVAHLLPAMVLEVTEKQMTILPKGQDKAVIVWENMQWAYAYITDFRHGRKPKKATDIAQKGDIIYVSLNDKNQYVLSQIPKVAGQLISLSPDNGAILALVGGFDFQQSKFNRTIQAQRQPGSNFKPFIYSAALNKGYTPASIINDAPIVFKDQYLEGSWRPQNYSQKFFGPTRLRFALTKSRNLVSIRILRDIGINYTLDYAKKFGFNTEMMPKNLSLALGSGVVTPIELVTGYATFANSGYKITPHFIERITDAEGTTLYQADPDTVCQNHTACQTTAKRIITASNAYLMTSILQDVIQYGTGRKAKVLKRYDIAGKTGTTNDQKDAWFSGYNQDVVTSCWVGFDTPRPLGRYETGGKAALPMWIDFMRIALKNSKQRPYPQPDNIITVKIDKSTGLLAHPQAKNTLLEYFEVGTAPKKYTLSPTLQNTDSNKTTSSSSTEDIF